MITLVLLPAFFYFNGPYLLGQGLAMWKLRRGMTDISILLQKEDLDPETRQFFALLEEIRDYAMNELGLEDTDNYLSYIRTDKTYLVDVVSAVRKDSLQRYEKWYPIVGPVFYRGYFDRRGAEKFAAHLRRKDYDVYIRKVGAYSSLGLLTDPVYSYMKNYSEDRLADMIIHEMVHATIWLPGYNQFNEEIATFIGREGAKEFVRTKYGKNSPLLESMDKLRQDSDTFNRLMMEVYDELAKTYAKTPNRMDRLRLKKEIISRTKESFLRDYDRLFLTPAYASMADEEWNHAFIDLFIQYGGDLAAYTRIHETLGGEDIRKTTRILTGLKDIKTDPRTALADLLRKAGISPNKEPR